MLTRLSRKLLTLFVLVAALSAVTSVPARPTSTSRGIFCVDAPLESGCSSTYWCCTEWGGGGSCWCQN
jgi:hypothetical protein